MRPILEPYVTRLPDGTWVQIRALTPEDRDAIRAGLTKLGERTIHERFLSPNYRPSEKDLEYLTTLDQHEHIALALGTLDDPPVGIGVARCVRSELNADTAEYAIVISDEFHNRGAGKLLLAHLAELAYSQGIRYFQGFQLLENTKIIGLTERIGTLEKKSLIEPGIVETRWKLVPEKFSAHLGVPQEPTTRWKSQLRWFASRLGLSGRSSRSSSSAGSSSAG
ncbi:MAG: GNAT family N-acetyltransferase [Sandaracinaceae bacterium]|nr:GNAT family N-acetyltransferase [Sandaracinaceae bacterium]